MLRTAQQHANTHARHTGQTNKLKETASYSVSRLACLYACLYACCWLLAGSQERRKKHFRKTQLSHYLSLSVLLICSDLTSFSACSYSVSVYAIVIMHSVCTIYTCAYYFYAYIKSFVYVQVCKYIHCLHVHVHVCTCLVCLHA